MPMKKTIAGNTTNGNASTAQKIVGKRASRGLESQLNPGGASPIRSNANVSSRGFRETVIERWYRIGNWRARPCVSRLQLRARPRRNDRVQWAPNETRFVAG